MRVQLASLVCLWDKCQVQRDKTQLREGMIDQKPHVHPAVVAVACVHKIFQRPGRGHHSIFIVETFGSVLLKTWVTP